MGSHLPPVSCFTFRCREMGSEILAYLGQPLPLSKRGVPQPRRTPRRPFPTMVASQRTRRARSRPPTSLLNSDSPPEAPTPRVRVQIDAPAPNKRIITASNLINAPLCIVWGLLSDYARLADHIPNLKISQLRDHPRDGIRVEQCGSQSILGFEFQARLVMDMTEVNANALDWRAINFDLVSSRDFTEFEGVWRMERVDDCKTALYYSVAIVPKGLVPVRAIEWRISEDVPSNMDAVRSECERRRRVAVATNRRNNIMDRSQLQ